MVLETMKNFREACAIVDANANLPADSDFLAVLKGNINLGKQGLKGKSPGNSSSDFSDEDDDTEYQKNIQMLKTNNFFQALN